MKWRGPQPLTLSLSRTSRKQERRARFVAHGPHTPETRNYPPDGKTCAPKCWFLSTGNSHTLYGKGVPRGKHEAFEGDGVVSSTIGPTTPPKVVRSAALVSRCGVTSTPGVTRTRDILLRRQMLYPAELRGLGT